MAGILTFLTDFGTSDHYVAAMKGVALGRAPALRIVDVSHDVPPQDLDRAAFVLAEAAPWFPAGTVHVVVVDPGVGTARRSLVARIDGQLVVAPDNGVISTLWRRGSARAAWSLEREGLGLDARSATFHGRDLYAPSGASLAAGHVAPEDCGPAITPILLDQPPPRVGEDGVTGRVQTVDRFGNLVSDLRDLPDGPWTVAIEGRLVPFVRTYGDAAEGDVVALYGSGGWLEVAQVNGSARTQLGLAVGATIAVRWG